MRPLKTVLWSMLAALVVMGGVAKAVASEAPFMIESIDNDYKSEVADAAGKGKNLVLFFHQHGCPYCDKMRARVFPDPRVIKYYSKHFVMIQTDIHGSLPVVTPGGKSMTEMDYARKLRVRATPVILFLDKHGKVALRLTGYQDPKNFVMAGKYVENQVYDKGTSFFRYLMTAGR